MATLISNPFAFWQQKVIFRASQTTTATTIPIAGSSANVIFDTVLEDPYSGYNLTTGKWLAPVTGWYQVTGTLAVNAVSAVGPSTIYMTYATNYTTWQVAAVPYPASAAPPKILEAPMLIYLAAGLHQIWMEASQLGVNATVTTDLTAGRNSHIEVTWLIA